MKKKILYVSSSRSDFGIISQLLIKIDKFPKIDLHILITGNHLSKDFGYTINEIKKIKNNKLSLLKIDDKKLINPNFVCKEILNKYPTILKKINPSAVMILGDRYEIAQIALITHLNDYPLVHFHGGEKTLGSKDDNFRHVISKLSQLHFVSHEMYKRRLIQLGEEKKNIKNVGSLSLEGYKYKKNNKKYLEDKYEFLKSKNKFFIITLHPSLTIKKTNHELNIIVKAIIFFKNLNFVFTSPNHDYGYKVIINKINHLSSKHRNIYYIKNFGKDYFLPILKLSSGLIGNSSSGVIEAPFLKKPSINIGDRQEGRLLSSTVYNCKNSINDLKKIIRLIDKKNYKINSKKIFITRKVNASEKILSFLNKKNFSKEPINKNFKDLDFK